MTENRLTVAERKDLLEEVIREKVNGRLTEKEIFDIICNININNQYTVRVVDCPNLFNTFIRLDDFRKYNKVERDIDGKTEVRLSYLGGKQQDGEVILGTENRVKFGYSRLREIVEIHDRYQYSVLGEFDEKQNQAVKIKTTNNYLSSDGSERDYKIRYEIIIYLAE